MQAVIHQLSTSKIAIPYIPILLSELSPAKLALFNPHISTFIQTSCPRLSIDWGYAFDKPLLSPYETAVAVGRAKGWMTEEKEGRGRTKGMRYPMDFYEAGSPWAVARMQVRVSLIHTRGRRFISNGVRSTTLCTLHSCCQ
jgi:2-(3-amino-3-carboxypropyl)histidine synthase